MKKIILLLCLGLVGCATVAKESKTTPWIIAKPTLANKMEMESVISVFTEAINNDPNYAGGYYNRAIAYFYKNNYEQCWRDVHVAETLGCEFSADFLNALKKASHRKK